MKTWMLVMAMAVPAAAQQAPVNESARAALIQEEDAFRETVFPADTQPTQMSRECLADLAKKKRMAQDAATPDALAAARVSYEATKATVLLRTRRAAGGSETRVQYTQRIDAATEKLLAARQKEAQARTASMLGFMTPRILAGGIGGFYDGQNDHGRMTVAPADVSKTAAVDALPRAESLPIGDQRRYAKIRALLAAQGVDKKIVETAISEGIRQGVDPMLVLGVIWKESTWKAHAHNLSSDCRGLMQLDPATAADMGAHGNLYDVGANIKAGVRYLRWIANDFFKLHADLSNVAEIPAKTLKTVLASYNWGIGHVQKAIERNGLQRLPGETRDYIAKITDKVSDFLGWS